MTYIFTLAIIRVIGRRKKRGRTRTEIVNKYFLFTRSSSNPKIKQLFRRNSNSAVHLDGDKMIGQRMSPTESRIIPSF